jgi:hypothetical protein
MTVIKNLGRHISPWSKSTSYGGGEPPCFHCRSSSRPSSYGERPCHISLRRQSPLVGASPSAGPRGARPPDTVAAWAERRPAMEEARAEFIRHRSRPLRPHLPVSSSPRRRRPPGPCCRPPTHHRPCHLLARHASTGPTGGKGGNGRAQRGAERAKPRFLASSRPNRSRERVFRLLPQRSCFGMPFGTASVTCRCLPATLRTPSLLLLPACKCCLPPSISTHVVPPSISTHVFFSPNTRS